MANASLFLVLEILCLTLYAARLLKIRHDISHYWGLNKNPGRGTGATLKGEHALYLFYPILLGLQVGD